MSVEELISVTRVYRGKRTQIPTEIARFLNVRDGDKIAWFMGKDGRVYIKKASSVPREKLGKYV